MVAPPKVSITWELEIQVARLYQPLGSGPIKYFKSLWAMLLHTKTTYWSFPIQTFQTSARAIFLYGRVLWLSQGVW